MNQARIRGQWKQVKGKIKEQWGRLTDDDLSTLTAPPHAAQGDFLSSSLGRWQNRGSNPDRSLILAFRTIANMADRYASPELPFLRYSFDLVLSKYVVVCADF